MASITHTQVRSVQAGPLYRVADTVTASVDIQPQVFVFQTSDNAFNRIATVDDMMTLPTSQAQAVIDGADYYRLNAVTKDYESLKTADDAATAIVDRIKRLLVEYDAAVTEFVGTTTETLTS